MRDDSRYANPLIDLFDATTRIRGRLKSAFAGSAAAAGLSEMEMTVLNAVAEARTPPTVPRIGRALGHPRQVIQRAANALVANGLIEAIPNPEHKRAVLLVPTELGRSRKREANARANQMVAKLLDSMDADLIIRTNENLGALRSQIELHFREFEQKHE